MPGRGRQSLPAAPHLRAAFPGLVSLCLCSGARKTFIVSPPPPVCDGIAAPRGPRSPAAATEGTCNPRPPGSRALRFLTCRSFPGTARGAPSKGTARASTAQHPDHRCGPARRNFNLIPVSHPGHPRPLSPPSLRSHKEHGEGRRRGRRARASRLPRQKGHCCRSGHRFRAAGSSSRPGLPLRLGPPRAVHALLGPRELRGARRCCWSGLQG